MRSLRQVNKAGFRERPFMTQTDSPATHLALSPGLLTHNGFPARAGALTSLLTIAKTKAYELKFLLSEAVAQNVERWAAARLLPDPHAEPALGNAYRVASLYLDTSRLDVFHRISPHRRRKLRVRGYASTTNLFLEQKTRRGDRVRKRRTVIAEADLHRLLQPAIEPDWPGAWFQQKFQAQNLSPTYQVGCLRSAYFSVGIEGPVRLTLDRHLAAVHNPGWRLLDGPGGLPLLAGQVVLELKYQSALPALFKGLLEEMVLTPSPVSKYRMAVRAWNPIEANHQVR